MAKRPNQTADATTKARAAKPRAKSKAPEPSEEEIRRRAYHNYLDRGAGHGGDFEDWLRAEQELKKKR